MSLKNVNQANIWSSLNAASNLPLHLLQLPCQVIRMMLEGGKTEAEESEELRNKINNFISDSCVSIDEKLSMVMQNLILSKKHISKKFLRIF